QAAGQRQPRPRQGRPFPRDPGQPGVDAPVCRLPQPRVRGAGFRLCVRQPLGKAAWATVGLPGRLRPGPAAARAHRHRLRAPPIPPHLRDLAAAQGGGDGVGTGTPRPRLDHHHDRHIRAPHSRGRPQDPGGRRLVHRTGGATVSTTVAKPASSRAGLLEKLMAAVRPEFRVEVYVPAAGDPVFRAAQCAVGGCDRMAHQRGLCNGHAIRWRNKGRPALAEFLADPGRPIRGRNELGRCAVKGCRYGVNSHGLCSKHHDRWVRVDRPDLGGWIAQAVLAGSSRAECGMPFCSLWVENATKFFCKNHDYRWRTAGCPDPDEYPADCQRVGTAHINLRGLNPQLRLEFQYALQRRHDEQARTTPPKAVRDAVRQAQKAGVTSLMDYSEQEWRQAARSRLCEPGLFILDAWDAVETLRDGVGWEVEYPRDVWRLHKLPASP